MLVNTTRIRGVLGRIRNYVTESRKISGPRDVIRKYPLSCTALSVVTGVSIVVTPLYLRPSLIAPLYKMKLENLPDERIADYIASLSDPLNLEKFIKLSGTISNNGQYTLDEWVDAIRKIQVKLLGNSLHGSIDKFKARAYSVLNMDKPLSKIISDVIDIYGDSIEAKECITKIIEDNINAHGYIPFKIFDNISNYKFAEFGSPVTNMIVGSILLCPLDIRDIFSVLVGNEKTDNEGLKIIKRYFDDLSEYQKSKVSEIVFMRIVKEFKNSENKNMMKNMIVKAIQSNHMLNSIFTDKYIDYLTIFIDNLEINTVAKLMSAVVTKKDNEMISECIDILGPVGIKLAQMYAEDTQVLTTWKDIIDSTKEKNKPSSLIDIYSNISNYGAFDQIGKCIGVGSIKQVHFVKSSDGTQHILGIRKLNCESKSKEVLGALKKIGEYRQIAIDFEKIIDSEVNLNNEANAFDIIRTHRFDQSNIIEHSHVVSNSLSTIVRTRIDGDTVNTLYKQGQLTQDDKNLIAKFHNLILDTAFEDNIVFSDLHMGNITINKVTNKITVIDVGQFQIITKDDITMAMWLLADIGGEKKFIHDNNMEKLTHSLRIKNDDIQKIECIFQKVYSNPNIRDRITIVGSELNKLGYPLPDSIMRICKMLDLVIQQRDELGIKENTLAYIETKFRTNLTYADIAWLGLSWVRRFGS